MKNITVAIDDETQRRARIRAAEMGTSLSALVKQYLQQLAEGPVAEGVREMPMTFTAPAAAQPKFVPLKKPRQPGAMRGMTGWTEDFDAWPDGFLDALYDEDTEAAKTWYK